MFKPQLYALTPAGPRPLAISPDATDFTDLYHGLTLGVYSVIRTFHHNCFFQLDHHLARTVRSMRLLGWDYQLDEERLRRAIHELCTAYPAAESRVRIDILAAPATALGYDSRELLALMPFTPPPAILYEQGVALGYATGLHRTNPLVKTATFAEERKQAEDTRFYEHLLTDEHGAILEATSANFYAVRHGVLYTAGEGVLEGVTRRIVLDLVTAAAIPLQLQAVFVNELSLLDEALISSSSRGVMPVVVIGEQAIGDGKPGPITQNLMAAYNGYVEAHLQTAIYTLL
ncbi:MAG: aminotransferase class IV [Caldilineaceae bacterium]|nr:aminotransferase class IV [Caldilineaceae bacterium]